MLPLEAPGNGPSRLYPILGALGIPGLVAASLPSPPPSSCGFSLCLCLSSSVSYKDTVIGFGATLIQDDLISDSSLILQKPFLQIMSLHTFWGTHLLGLPLNPLSLYKITLSC